MVIDTSAIIAILFAEAEAGQFAARIKSAQRRLMPAAALLESSIVIMTRKGEGALRMLDELRHDAAVETVAFDENQALLARDAFLRYGKGRHRAGLNFGDCFSYALAMSEALPLLYKGEDFSHTDILSAL